MFGISLMLWNRILKIKNERMLPITFLSYQRSKWLQQVCEGNPFLNSNVPIGATLKKLTDKEQLIMSGYIFGRARFFLKVYDKEYLGLVSDLFNEMKTATKDQLRQLKDPNSPFCDSHEASRVQELDAKLKFPEMRLWLMGLLIVSLYGTFVSFGYALHTGWMPGIGEMMIGKFSVNVYLLAAKFISLSRLMGFLDYFSKLGSLSYTFLSYVPWPTTMATLWNDSLIPFLTSQNVALLIFLASFWTFCFLLRELTAPGARWEFSMGDNERFIYKRSLIQMLRLEYSTIDRFWINVKVKKMGLLKAWRVAYTNDSFKNTLDVLGWGQWIANIFRRLINRLFEMGSSKPANAIYYSRSQANSVIRLLQWFNTIFWQFITLPLRSIGEPLAWALSVSLKFAAVLMVVSPLLMIFGMAGYGIVSIIFELVATLDAMGKVFALLGVATVSLLGVKETIAILDDWSSFIASRNRDHLIGELENARDQVIKLCKRANWSTSGIDGEMSTVSYANLKRVVREIKQESLEGIKFELDNANTALDSVESKVKEINAFSTTRFFNFIVYLYQVEETEKAVLLSLGVVGLVGVSGYGVAMIFSTFAITIKYMLIATGVLLGGMGIMHGPLGAFDTLYNLLVNWKLKEGDTLDLGLDIESNWQRESIYMGIYQGVQPEPTIIQNYGFRLEPLNIDMMSP